MQSIFFRSTVATVFSVLISLAVVVTIVPALGGVVDGNAWLMTIICPVVVAWPASALTFWQNDRLKRANAELAALHAALLNTHGLLAEKARRDHMTGALNRESFFEVLIGTQEQGCEGALLIIDVDHFKKVNDNYGHLAGDDALRLISDAILNGVRAGDIVGRLGGEEFGVVLVGATEGEAKAVAERIRRKVEALVFEPGGEKQPLTVSIGGSPLMNGLALSTLMRTADERLYRAKSMGRNRTVYEQDVSLAA